jgi:hypothetical protein
MRFAGRMRPAWCFFVKPITSSKLLKLLLKLLLLQSIKFIIFNLPYCVLLLCGPRAILLSNFGPHMYQGGDSQNFLGKLVRIFINFGLKTLRFFRFTITFWSRYHWRVMLTTVQIIMYLFSMNNYSVKAPESYKKYYKFA